jgi:hypothetical protein
MNGQTLCPNTAKTMQYKHVATQLSLNSNNIGWLYQLKGLLDSAELYESAWNYIEYIA